MSHTRDIKYPLWLINKEVISQDVWRPCFALPSPQHMLGLPLASTFTLCLNQQEPGPLALHARFRVMTDQGFMDLVIKV